MFSRKVTTLSIEAGAVRALTLNGRRVERWGRLPLAAGLVKDGLIVQPKAVGQAIDALFRSLGGPKSRVIVSLSGIGLGDVVFRRQSEQRRSRVIVSLSGIHSAPRLVTLPRVKGALLEEAMRQQAKKEMPLPLEEIDLSWWPIGGKDGELEFFVVGVPRPIADAQVQTLVESGVKPYIMDLKPMALTRAVDHRDALIVDLEPEAFGITLVAEGIPAIWRTITPRQEEMVLEDMVQQLTGDVSKIVEFHNQAHPESPLSAATPVFLTGELSEDATVCELIQAGMKHPVEPLVMPLECPSAFPAASYAVNIGLALKKTAPKVRSKGAATIVRPINFNTLPERYRARRWPVRYMLFSLVAIIAIAGLFPAYQAKAHSDPETVRPRVELDRATRQLRQARLAVDREKALMESLNKAVTAAETLEQDHRTILAKGRFAHVLRPIWSSLPPGVGLTSMELALDQIILKGDGNSRSLGLSYGKALEQMSIFTEVNISELSDATFGITLKR